MATLISGSLFGGVVSFHKGEQIFVRHIVGGFYPVSVAEVLPREWGNVVRFTCDALAVVEGLSENLRSAKHMRFAREERQRSDLRSGGKVWGRLRRALTKSAAPAIVIPGGFHQVLVYGDEIAVANFSEQGSSGWIVNRRELDYWLRQEPAIVKPALPEGQERLQVVADEFTRLGEVIVQVERYGPYNKPYRVTVIAADPGLEDRIGHRFWYWKGQTLPSEGEDLEFWGQIPPHPVCPRCGQGRHLGYNHAGTEASCWTRDANGEIVTCWEGSVTELKQDEANANPWVKAISYQGCI